MVAPDELRVGQLRFTKILEQELIVVDGRGRRVDGLWGHDRFILATRQGIREACAHAGEKATPAKPSTRVGLAHASSSARCCARRSANATIVRVGLAAAPVVNTALPAT